MDRRPPLAVSPRRLRPRRRAAPPQVSSSVQTPPGDLPICHSRKQEGSMKKALAPIRASVCTLSPYRPEPIPRMKLDLTEAIPRKAKEELEDTEEMIVGIGLASAAMNQSTGSPLFERGRFYELYSARRNERLKIKQAVLMEEAEAIAQNPCIAVELSKRRTAKKAEAVRKSTPADFSVSRASSLRSSSLRSSKEMKKSSAAAASCAVKSSGVKERRVSTRLSSARRV